MRFHIGFSKRIKPSNILFWLGALFFGLLAFFGVIDHGYALTSNLQPTMFYNLNNQTQYPTVQSSASDYYYYPSSGGRDFHAIYDLDGLCPSDSGSIIVQVNFLDSVGNYLYKSSNFQVKYNGTNDSLNYTMLNYSNVSGFAKIQIDNVDMTKDLLIISNLDDYSNVGIFAIHNTIYYTCNPVVVPPSPQGIYNICSNELYDRSVIHYSTFNQGNIIHGNTDNGTLERFESECSDPNTDDYFNISSTDNNSFYEALFRAVKSTDNSRPVLNDITLDLNDNFCSGINDIRSLDLFFNIKQNSLDNVNQKLTESPFNNHYGQLTNYNQLLSFYVEPVYSGENVGPPVDYACNLTSNSSNSNLYNITCIGVPYSSNIVDYKIKIYNNFYYSLENRNDIYYVTNTASSFFNNIFINKEIDYQCSSTEPVRPDQPLLPDDAVGSANIVVNVENDGSAATSTVLNDTLYIDWFNEFDIPQSLNNLILLPMRLVTVITNDPVNTCQPLSINLSSITQEWGGFDYSLSIPCMRTYLYNLLDTNIVGSLNLYNLADILMAFGLSIWFGQKVWLVINDIISGNDLHNYLVLDHKNCKP